jgi:hypothetical protein
VSERDAVADSLSLAAGDVHHIVDDDKLKQEAFSKMPAIPESMSPLRLHHSPKHTTRTQAKRSTR